MQIQGSSSPSSPAIIRRKSTLTANRDFYTRHVSLELLNPTHDSMLRKTPLAVAIFNLVATVCGGGVLSLPYAVARAGILPCTGLMFLAAAITNFSLYILCSCARRTGGHSYGDVSKSAFGPVAEIGTNVFLILLLLGILVAYMVLVKDIWTPMIFNLAISMHLMTGENFSEEDFDSEADVLLGLLLLLVSPLLLKRDLYALRYTCYVGFASLILLTVGLAYRSFQLNFIQQPGIFSKKVKWSTNDVKDVIFAFPICALSFMCCYNVLSVHGSLINPTRERVLSVLNGTIGICLVLFSMVGLFGYLDCYGETQGNIFLNFTTSDNLLLLGRVGYGFTLLFGLPLVTLPCREAVLAIPDQIREWLHFAALTHETRHASMLAPVEEGNEAPHLIVNGVDFDSDTPPAARVRTANRPTVTYGTTTATVASSNSPDVEVQSKAYLRSSTAATTPAQTSSPRSSLLGSYTDDSFLEEPTLQEYLVHFISTAIIVGGGYFAAVAVPSVATVWSIAGSSMAILISFVIPAACYLKIRWRKSINPRSILAWFLLVLSILAGIICTAQTVSEIAKGTN